MSLPDPEFQPEFYRDVALKRLIAWVVDTVVVLVLTLLAIPLSLFTALFYLPILYLALTVLYRSATIALYGATPGMRLTAIELRRLDGARPDPQLAFLHTLGYTVSMSLIVPQVVSVFMMLTSRQCQGLSDVILSTTVLNRPARD